MNRPRLSAFQSLMREWSDLAPYNFIHAMRLDTPLDVDRWKNALTATIQELELIPNPVLVEEPVSDLETQLRSELHRPFRPTEAPMRFFALKENGGHWFGVTVDHWFADDYSCRLFLEQVYAAYRDETREAESTVRRPEIISRSGMASPAFMPGRWLRNWAGFIKQAMVMRRACRTPMRDPMDFNVRLFRTTAPESALEAGRAMARRHGATLHDVFLATTAQAFAAARAWELGARRDRVAIASAMDLRRFDSERLSNRFGLLISHYVVTVKRPDERSLGEVVESIAAQSRQFKADPQTDPHGPARSLWLLSRSKRAKATHYLRGAPLVAGLSNVNLTGSWIENSDIAEYRRIGPTGPVVPMVLMITTLRGRIYFDVTYRGAAFGEQQAREVVGAIIHRLPT